jgi:glycylpeptide N-tetradecanoyltransferase
MYFPLFAFFLYTLPNQTKQIHAHTEQPMPHGNTREGLPEGPIAPDKPLSEIRSDPYSMPKGFVWSNVDVSADIQELYTLLSNNYVEDDDALFRFDYSADFLQWALQPPNGNPDLLFGVRSAASHKLVAFISGIPTTVQIYDRVVEVVEINFLCVHKKLRSKRLAPVLIKEITRRVNLTGVFQAVYTAGTVLPVPVSSSRYYHRNLNPKKLVQVGFSRLGNRMTMARMLKLCKLPDTVGNDRLRPMEERDVVGVHRLLTTYLAERFQLKILFTVDEVRHWLLPRPKVINSYVMCSSNDADDDNADGTGGTVTDFVSFYHLPSSILHHNDTLRAAYSFYNVATTVSLTELMRDALILAKTECDADVFNALDLMENTDFLEALKFGKGDGNLQYYVYNWACPEMPPSKVGIVLL